MKSSQEIETFSTYLMSSSPPQSLDPNFWSTLETKVKKRNKNEARLSKCQGVSNCFVAVDSVLTARRLAHCTREQVMWSSHVCPVEGTHEMPPTCMKRLVVLRACAADAACLLWTLPLLHQQSTKTKQGRRHRAPVGVRRAEGQPAAGREEEV